MTIAAALSIATGRIGQHQQPACAGIAERGEREYPRLLCRDRHAAGSGGRRHRAGRAQRACRPQCRYGPASGSVQSERDGRRPADAADRVAGDRFRTGNTWPEHRHRQPYRQPAGPVLRPAERPEQPDTASTGGQCGVDTGTEHQHAEQCLYGAAADRPGRHRCGSCHGQQHPCQHRQSQHADHPVEGNRPEHRGSGEPT